MPRRPVPPEELTVGQILRRLAGLARELEALGSRYEMTNGELRFHVKRIERELRALTRALRRATNS